MNRFFGPGSGLTNQPIGLDVGIPSGGAGSNIKSEQTASTTWSTTATTLDITISSVNVANSAVDISVYTDFNTPNVAAISATLLNSTTVRLTRTAGLNLGTAAIIFITVYEFNNVKSKQTGTVVAAAAEVVVTVSNYNQKKSQLFVSSTSTQTTGTSFDYLHVAGRTISNTTIGFTSGASSTAYYQLLEFI